MFPIAIQSYERPFLLALTLRSVFNSVKNVPIIIFDDYSECELANKFLFSNDEIYFDQEIFSKNNNLWKKSLGDIPDIRTFNGVDGKFKVLRPPVKMGVRGFGLWIIEKMMSLYPDCEGFHLIQGDAIVSKDWYDYVSSVSSVIEKLGLLSGFNRNMKSDYGYCLYKGLCGVHLMVFRDFYKSVLEGREFNYPVNKKGFDSLISNFCLKSNYRMAMTYPSVVQHIGFDSTIWKEGNGSYSENFMKPYSF